MHKVTEHQQPGYTIIGNHLAQHRALSGLAIGFAVHIQSLPEGAPVDIRTLAKRFPEGRDRIASALRELEAYGYLERVRRRTDDGRLVTITISYNDPEATRARRARESAEQAEQAEQAEEAEHRTAADPLPALPAPADPAPTAPTAPASTTLAPAAPAKPEPAAASAPEAPAAPPAPAARPPLPHPHTREHHTTASSLLANLRREDPRLLLSVRDIDRLAPAVATWLERGAPPDSVRTALVTCLPPTLRHPAALLAHRLTALLPPPLPAESPPAARTVPRPHPLQTCDGCDRAFRAPAPGLCRDCRAPATAQEKAAQLRPRLRAGRFAKDLGFTPPRRLR
ncbi:helix-turn-helix domain-containing protein [Streptomyces inhibens]|uniref:helix-turn-helix domain-containing protein n=1 Tax=Streptomyces inhibens TaxID=2293571 RepID=UPI00402A693C